MRLRHGADSGSSLVPLPRAFFERDALVLARALIGTRLVVRREPGALAVARIVETEAYRGPKDLACHARVGITTRTKTLYGPPGHAYVFLIYGMYDCFNVVCFGRGKGHAVLVRAVEPVSGIGSEARTAGPGRLTRALGITRADDAADLVEGAPRIFVAARDGRPRIAVSPRVGVAYAGEWADRAWRFFDPKSEHVSRPPARSIGRPRPAATAVRRSAPSLP
jgi:DNA-3-methyladenine glycosylase